MPRVLFIGLGKMGSAMADRLVSTYDLAAYDVLPTAVQQLAEKGARTAEHPADLATDAEVVILSLPTSGDVAEVLFGRDGITDVLAAGSLVIDMTSGDPAESTTIAASLAERGIRFADAPVSGGRRGAIAGTLMIMVGADDADADEVVELLTPLGEQVIHVGAIGAGHTMKLINNMLAVTNKVAALEAASLAIRCGIDPATFVDVVNRSTGRSQATDTALSKFILPGRPHGMRLSLIQKDVSLARKLAEDQGVHLACSSLATGMMMSFDGGHKKGESDPPESNDIALYFEQQYGIELYGSLEDAATPGERPPPS